MKLYISLSERLKTQQLAIEQLVAGINSEKLTMPPIPGKWSAFPFRSMALTELLNMINSDRAIIFELMSDLDDAEVLRIGVHPKYGRLTILKWAEFFLLHEAHHMFTIFQLVNGSE